MLKKAILLLIAILAAPDLATAYNYWYITASSSPAISGAITAPSGPGYVTSGATTNITSADISSADFTVNASPPGYLLSYVSVDGVKHYAPNNGAFYRVSKGTKVGHTLSAVYTAQRYTISTSKTGNGYITPTATVTAGSSKTITMTPATGYRIGSVSAGGATLTDGDGVTSAAYTFTNVLSDKNISVVFEAVPAMTARIQTPPQTITLGNSLTVDGSASSYTGTPTFTWGASPAGASVTPAADGRTALFVPDAVGNYTVSLTLTDAGQPTSVASIAISVVYRAAYDAEQCNSCHATRSPSIVGAYMGSGHAATLTTTCTACHNPTGTVTHYYYLSPFTVSTTSFRVLDSSAGTVGSIFCNKCHTAQETEQSAAHGAMICTTCHSSVHGPDLANAGITRAYCGTCHGSRAGAIASTSAGHGNACSGCHGAYAHNPTVIVGVAANPCFTCHKAPNSAHYFEIATAQLNGLCSNCHFGTSHEPKLKQGVAARHFNGYTSLVNPQYAAAYVTPATRCADCHKLGDAGSSEDLAIAQYRRDWAASGHGDTQAPAWLNSASQNWKASGMAGVKVSDMGFAYGSADCLRCHSASGYVQFANQSSISPLAAPAARYSEPLACNACHNDDFSPRSVSARTGYYNYTSAGTGKLLVASRLPDSRSSNICLGCHLGRAAGDTIKAMAAATAHKNYSTSFWQNVSFVNSHYLAAGGQLFAVTGYEYPGESYSNSVDHSTLGGAAGPCIACHMPDKSHTFSASAASYSQCGSCHDTTVDSTFLADKKANLKAALGALSRALEQKGLAPNMVDGNFTYPYFSNKNWGNKDTGPATMGAAFNYNLLMHDEGAFAHNPTYAKRLIRDSIDFLVNGSVDRGRGLDATIDSLLADVTERADAKAFLVNSANGSAACSVCHSADLDPASQLNILASYSKSLHASDRDGASCGSCHAQSSALAHPPALTMLTAAADISAKCDGCHPGQHSWPTEGACMECHNAHNPMQLKLGYPHFGTFSSAQYVAGNLSCDSCHYQAGVRKFSVYSASYQWGQSRHGDPLSTAYVGPGPYSLANLESYDFKLLGTPQPSKPANSASKDCVRCHTSTGYINYVTPVDPQDPNTAFSRIEPWGSADDRTREMVGCPVCHTPTPFSAEFGRRSVGIMEENYYTTVVRAWYNYSSAATGKIIRSKSFVNPSSEMGDSNICIACHSGTAAGDLLKQGSNCKYTPSIACKLGNNNAAAGLTGTFWSNVDFIDPHGAAASFLFPDGLRPGYEYRPSGDTSGHIDVGNFTGQGPCVGCHMSSPNKHSFSAISTASNGVIAAVSTDVCASCHYVGGSSAVVDAAVLEQKRQNYRAGVAVIERLLADKGIHYNRSKPPYFFTTSDQALQSFATRRVNWNIDAIFQGGNVMGAALNLRLLDSGAVWIHNGIYGKRLLYDTIDYLDDGTMNYGVTVESQTLHQYLNPR